MANEKNKAVTVIRSVAAKLGIDQQSLEFDDTQEDVLTAKADLGEFKVVFTYFNYDDYVSVYFKSEEINIGTVPMPVDSSDKIESIYSCIRAKRRESCPWVARAVADILLNELGADIASPQMRDPVTCDLSVIYTTDYVLAHAYITLKELPDNTKGHYSYSARDREGAPVTKVKGFNSWQDTATELAKSIKAYCDELTEKNKDIIQRRADSAILDIDYDWAEGLLGSLCKAAKYFSVDIFTVSVDTKNMRITIDSANEDLVPYSLAFSDNKEYAVFTDGIDGKAGYTLSKQDWESTKESESLDRAWEIIAAIYTRSMLKRGKRPNVHPYATVDWHNPIAVGKRMTERPYLPESVVTGTCRVTDAGFIEVKTKVFFYTKPRKGLVNIDYLVYNLDAYPKGEYVDVKVTVDSVKHHVCIYEKSSPLEILGKLYLQDFLKEE